MLDDEEEYDEGQEVLEVSAEADVDESLLVRRWVVAEGGARTGRQRP